MPELPDLTVYLESLEARIANQKLVRVRLLNPFLLRTAVPPISAAEGRTVVGLRRLGKRVVIGLEGELFLVLHLMVAGRLRWLEGAAKPPGRITLGLFDFDSGTLALTEAGTKRRASLHVVQGEAALAAMDPGGKEFFQLSAEEFQARLTKGRFPEKVTACREGMAVHGRYRKPCPVCGAPVQRIRYAENETNYCARCQTGGKVLADRSLSRLLRESWPRNIDELER